MSCWSRLFRQAMTYFRIPRAASCLPSMTLSGIPLGAAKLVRAMLEGVDLKDYSDRAGISMNTVRFHLKTAFARTETRSQAALVRNALSALSDLGPYFPAEE